MLDVILDVVGLRKTICADEDVKKKFCLLKVFYKEKDWKKINLFKTIYIKVIPFEIVSYFNFTNYTKYHLYVLYKI